MVCTGRSDFPNQVNNVLCFPYIFRGALDVGATAINEEMKRAAVEAIAGLAREEPSEVAARAYGGVTHTFGPEYLIPSPFDQRLILRIAPAVARAAMETGVATRPIRDFDAYHDRLVRFVFRSGLVMKPVTAVAKAAKVKSRIVYSDGEDERVLRAAQVLLEEGIATPILIGRPKVIATRCERFGLKIRPDVDLEVVDPAHDHRYNDYVGTYFAKVGRKGITPDAAKTIVRSNATVIGAVAVERGEADVLICGLEGGFIRHLKVVEDVIGLESPEAHFATLSLLLSQRGSWFLTDTYGTPEPTPEEIARTTILAARHIRRFGLPPKAALLSASNFGSRDLASAAKMREALAIVNRLEPELEIDGEMHGDAALNTSVRERMMPNSPLKGEANLLVFPSLDAANITLNLVKAMTDALHVGPILLGAAKVAHVLTPSVTSRGVVNMSTLAAVEAGSRAAAKA
jgi:malate dehydrogenase (oxaloacetate-decarboxylating)(NADP+)